jgi:hypothetical protein
MSFFDFMRFHGFHANGVEPIHQPNVPFQRRMNIPAPQLPQPVPLNPPPVAAPQPVLRRRRLNLAQDTGVENRSYTVQREHLLIQEEQNELTPLRLSTNRNSNVLKASGFMDEEGKLKEDVDFDDMATVLRESQQVERDSFVDAILSDDEELPPVHEPRVNSPSVVANPPDIPPLEIEDEDIDDDDDDDDDIFDPIENDIPPVEGELRFAVDELLGLRRLTHLFRNAWLLLAFNFVYIGVFATFPYIIGREVFQQVNQSYWIGMITTYLSNTAPTTTKFFSDIVNKSVASGEALQCTDLILIALGYCTMVVGIFALSRTLRELRDLARPSFLINLVSNVIAVSNILKVGILLFVRVFFLPINLGKYQLILLSQT